LFRLVLSQSLVLAGVGLVAGGLLFVAGQALLGVLKPQFAITLTLGSVQRVVIAALAMGLLATLLPARRLMAMAPALAFRGA
jgi:ABC-type antimicrobial peptide transport system permease subunit